MGDHSNKKINSTSSVFLSPPSSGCFPSKSVSKLESWNRYEDKPTFLLDDEEDGKEVIRIDILQKLSDKNLYRLIGSKILDLLPEEDLLRFSHVCSSWKSITQFHLKSARRILRYLKQKKKLAVTEKENLAAPSCSEPKTPTKQSSVTPLKTLNQNVESEKHVTAPALSTPVVDPESKSVYRHCPDCHSPSRTIFKQIGHCKQCEMDFCLHCLYSNNKHSPTCVVTGGTGVTGGSPRRLDKSRSPKRHSGNVKERKTRLKRL